MLHSLGLGYGSYVLPSLTPERLGADVDGRLAVGLSRALEPALERPRLAGGVEIASFTTRWGERYAIAHSPLSGAYLRLSGEESDLARRLDGNHSVGELVVGWLAEHGDLEPWQLADLVCVLRAQRFLEDAPMDTYAAVRERLSPRRRRAAQNIWRWLRKQTITLPGVDAFVGAVYRGGGRLLFTLPANVLAVAVISTGLVAFVALARRGTYSLGGHVSTGTAVSLFGLGLVALFVHEMGHALAVKYAGRRIVGAGFQLYLGNPAFFIDSSDLLLSSRRARAINALAGPYAQAVVAGTVSLLAWTWPGSARGDVLFRLAGVIYLGVLINLIPFIELDGYWLVSDLLDLPRLRHRAYAVLRYELPDRVRRRRPRLSPSERGLLAFAIAGVVFTAAALWSAWLLWGPIAARLLASLWDAGLPGRGVLVLLFLLVLGPLIHTAGTAARVSVRRTRAIVSDIRFRLQTSWRVEAANAVADLPLVGRLDDSILGELAGRVSRHRVAAGQVVIRQGEAPSAFYVVRRGMFAVFERDARGEESLLRRAGPGHSFGELALLERTPRTATVRAETDGEIFAVDAGTFLRILAPGMTEPSLAPAVRPTLQVWGLKPFRHLSQREAALLAARGQWITRGPGEVIFRQGEVGHSFYVIQSGQVETLRNDSRTALLRSGDHFGEIALLERVPRTATLRTLTPSRLFRIDSETFRTLVASSFDGKSRATDRYQASAH